MNPTYRPTVHQTAALTTEPLTNTPSTPPHVAGEVSRSGAREGPGAVPLSALVSFTDAPRTGARNGRSWASKGTDIGPGGGPPAPVGGAVDPRFPQPEIRALDRLADNVPGAVQRRFSPAPWGVGRTRQPPPCSKGQASDGSESEPGRHPTAKGGHRTRRCWIQEKSILSIPCEPMDKSQDAPPDCE